MATTFTITGQRGRWPFTAKATPTIRHGAEWQFIAIGVPVTTKKAVRWPFIEVT